MFEKLSPGRNYSIQVRTRNARGVGPASEGFGATAPHLSEYIERKKIKYCLIISSVKNEK